MKTYRNVIDRFALNTLQKLPDIPDFHLMVGSAESLNSLPLLVYENAKVPVEVVEVMGEAKENSLQDISEAIENNHLEVNDLNWNLALIGSGLGV
jgi:hypothetical protein